MQERQRESRKVKSVVEIEMYLLAISPRYAFSLAINGGLNVDWHFGKCVMATGEDIFSNFEEAEVALALLIRPPIASVW